MTGANMAAAASFGRIDRFFDRIGAIETPFSIEMPNGNKREVGEGEPQFHVALRTDRAVARALVVPNVSRHAEHDLLVFSSCSQIARATDQMPRSL